MRKNDGGYVKVVKLLERLVGLSILAIFVAVVLYAIYPAFVESKLEIGMNKSVVLSTVGKEPLWEQSQLELCSKHQWYGNCEAALKSNASQYLVWKLGIDTYLVVGLDKKSNLVFKGLGDT
jgi:hypothetical protein